MRIDSDLEFIQSFWHSLAKLIHTIRTRKTCTQSMNESFAFYFNLAELPSPAKLRLHESHVWSSRDKIEINQRLSIYYYNKNKNHIFKNCITEASIAKN